MTHAPTQPDRGLVRGRLAEVAEGMIVLAIPETSYRLHLVVDTPPKTPVGKPVIGRIHARAKRVDVVPSGGRYIEPVIGRPRRLQGWLAQMDRQAKTITVLCGAPFTCTLEPRQSPGDFQVGQLVSFDIERGAKFVPEA
jgi:hypothetical protein